MQHFLESVVCVAIVFGFGVSYVCGQDTQPGVYVFPNAEKRLERLRDRTFGPGAWIGSGIGATFQHIDNAPPEWKKSVGGFARRYASTFATNAIEEGSIYTISELSRQDPAYRRCNCTGTGNRTLHALKSGFTATNRRGKTVFSPAKVASPFISNVIANEAWYPKRYSYKDGVRAGAYGVLFNAGFNLIEEFIFKRK